MAVRPVEAAPEKTATAASGVPTAILTPVIEVAILQLKGLLSKNRSRPWHSVLLSGPFYIL